MKYPEVKSITTKGWIYIKYPLLVGILIWLFVQSAPIFRTIVQSKPDYFDLLMAVIVYQVGIFLISERFRIMLAATGVVRGYWHCFRSYLESVPYFFISPGGIGIEVSRYMKLTSPENNQGEEGHKIIFALLADRVVGLMACVLVGLLGISTLTKILSGHDEWVIVLGAFVIFGGVGFYGGIIILQKYASKLFLQLRDVLRLVKSRPFPVALSMLLGIFSQLSLGFTVYYIALAVHIDISWLTVLWVTAAGMVMLVVPTTIFGFTLMDVSVVMFYLLCGVSLQDATFLSLVGYGMRVWLAVQGVVLEFMRHITFFEKRIL